MNLILDNPIFHALNTDNKSFASGSDDVKYIKRDVGIFSGLKTNTETELTELHSCLPSGSRYILFTTEPLPETAQWKINLKKPLLQMIFEKSEVDPIHDKKITPLSDENIPAMLELTSLTNPGPFLQRTIDFGNYEGIFDGEKLVSMTGQRLQPAGYTEISAVCTHPSYTGRGYAAKLIISQLNKIISAGRVPFLHAYPDNPAVRLYEKLGFKERRLMLVYVLEAI